jgi:hypothetical protein
MPSQTVSKQTKRRRGRDTNLVSAFRIVEVNENLKEVDYFHPYTSIPNPILGKKGTKGGTKKFTLLTATGANKMFLLQLLPIVIPW